MPKDTYYFPHDYSATSNPKISAMIGNYKAEGFGIYWHIIELLHQNDDHKLPLKKHMYLAIAKQMLTSAEQVLKFIRDCIDEYELFYESDGFFYSDRVTKNIEKRQEISEKRSQSGRKGFEAKQAIAKQVQANAEQKEAFVKQNQAKERKGKETTIKSSKGFAAPFLEDVVKYFVENGYSEQSATTAFNYYNSANWVDSRGNQIRSWKQKMISVWFKPENIKSNILPLNERPVIDHRKNAEGWK